MTHQQEVLKDQYSQWLSSYPWTNWVTIRMETRDPKEAYRYLQKHLIRPLASAYGCRLGALGVLSDDPHLHVHLLLSTNSDRFPELNSNLDPQHVEALLGANNPLLRWGGILEIEPIRDFSAVCKYVAGHLVEGGHVIDSNRRYLENIRVGRA